MATTLLVGYTHVQNSSYGDAVKLLVHIPRVLKHYYTKHHRMKLSDINLMPHIHRLQMALVCARDKCSTGHL